LKVIFVFFQINYFKIPTLQEGIEHNIFVTTRYTNVHMLHSVSVVHSVLLLYVLINL